MGCIVQKDAAEQLEDRDIDRIESLDTPPMYLTEEVLGTLRGEHRVIELEWLEVKFTS